MPLQQRAQRAQRATGAQQRRLALALALAYNRQRTAARLLPLLGRRRCLVVRAVAAVARRQPLTATSRM